AGGSCGVRPALGRRSEVREALLPMHRDRVIDLGADLLRLQRFPQRVATPFTSYADRILIPDVGPPVVAHRQQDLRSGGDVRRGAVLACPTGTRPGNAGNSAKSLGVVRRIRTPPLRVFPVVRQLHGEEGSLKG